MWKEEKEKEEEGTDIRRERDSRINVLSKTYENSVNAVEAEIESKGVIAFELMSRFITMS